MLFVCHFGHCHCVVLFAWIVLLANFYASPTIDIHCLPINNKQPSFPSTLFVIHQPADNINTDSRLSTTLG